MNKEEIKNALERLEEKLHDIGGYRAPQILFEMGIPVNPSNEVKLRNRLRKMISKKIYPEFEKTGGEFDIVYAPHGKNEGYYRLSKYRGK